MRGSSGNLSARQLRVRFALLILKRIRLHVL